MIRSFALLLVGAASAALSACETVDVVVVPVAGVEVFPPQLSLVEGEAATLQAVVSGPGGVTLSGRGVQWRSSAQATASVDGTGRVMAQAPGTAYVVASVEGFRDSTSVTVLPGPAIVLATGTAALTAVSGESSAGSSVAITNGGSGVLSGLTLSVDYGAGPAGWLDATLNGTQAPTSLNLVGRAQGLVPGQYSAVVTVSSPVADNAPTVEVTLTVTDAPPSIVLSTDAVVLNGQVGGAQQTVSVEVTNGGGQQLTGLFTTVVYAEGDPGGWLAATLDATVAPTDVNLTATPGLLPPGTYEATVFVFSPVADNSPQSVGVTFTVTVASGSGGL